MPKPPRIADLEVALGHTFDEKALIERALTHASARADEAVTFDNERLEFLGDRVLGLSVARMLFAAFPDVDEGALARRFNSLVRRETCADVGEALSLGNYLKLGSSERSSGGRRKTTILANACEAVLGAVFLDGGFEAADRVVQRHWHAMLCDLEETPEDAKSALQEWAQGQGLPLPKYRQVARSGPDHAPRFETSVEVRGIEVAKGAGTSKRAAEQRAAEALLVREGVWPEPTCADAKLDV